MNVSRSCSQRYCSSLQGTRGGDNTHGESQSHHYRATLKPFLFTPHTFPEPCPRPPTVAHCDLTLNEMLFENSYQSCSVNMETTFSLEFLAFFFSVSFLFLLHNKRLNQILLSSSTSTLTVLQFVCGQ